MDVLSSLQHAIDIAGKLRALSKKVEDADFKMLVADLSNDLADAKLEAATLKGELARLTDANRELQGKLAQRDAAKPDLNEGAYTFSGEKGHFCTACFDVRRERVRVTRLSPPFDTFGRWECPSCHAILGGGDEL
ncbi:MAG TPA: hypothetical protein VGE20_02755 [Ramlibacter sp.]